MLVLIPRRFSLLWDLRYYSFECVVNEMYEDLRAIYSMIQGETMGN